MNIHQAEAQLAAERAKRVAVIVKRVNAGSTFSQIARDHGISRERVRQLWFSAKGEGRK